NRLAIAADLLGAWALGPPNRLCLTGDPLSVGDEPDAAPVNDLRLLDLIALASTLREDSKLPSGTDIDPAPRYFVGVADSPLVAHYDPARLEVKLDGGAGVVMTQIAYDLDRLGAGGGVGRGGRRVPGGAGSVMTQIPSDLDRLAAWAEVVRARGVFERTAVFVGVAPLRSAKQARYMNEHLPGVHVPDALLRALEDAGPEAEARGAARGGGVA